MHNKFNKLTDTAVNELINFLNTDFSDNYTSNLMEIYKNNSESSAVNEILINNEKLFVTAHSEQFVAKCQSRLLEILQNVGINQGRSTTLCNQIMFETQTPKFSQLILHHTPPTIKISSDTNKNSNSIKSDCVAGAAFLGVAAAGFSSKKRSRLTRTLMVTAGLCGAAVQTKKIFDEISAESPKNEDLTNTTKNTADIEMQYEKDIICGAKKAVEVLNKWCVDLFANAVIVAENNF